MTWWIVAVVGWMVTATALALLVGRIIRDADERELGRFDWWDDPEPSVPPMCATCGRRHR